MRFFITISLLVIVNCFFALQAQAFRLEPMMVSFSPVGEGATKIFRIENEAKDKVAVKVKAYKREIDENGKENLTESKDFKIYPEQVTLNASDSRAVRVMYIGKKILEQEGAYRIVAAQLPVDFKGKAKKSGINFLFEFVASVYVSSEKFSPKIEVESINRIDKENLNISIINRGQKHVLLSDVTIELKDTNGKIVKLDGSLIKDWGSQNLLSGSRRVLKAKTVSDFDLQKNKPLIDVKDEN